MLATKTQQKTVDMLQTYNDNRKKWIVQTFQSNQYSWQTTIIF